MYLYSVYLYRERCNKNYEKADAGLAGGIMYIFCLIDFRPQSCVVCGFCFFIEPYVQREIILLKMCQFNALGCLSFNEVSNIRSNLNLRELNDRLHLLLFQSHSNSI